MKSGEAGLCARAAIKGTNVLFGDIGKPLLSLFMKPLGAFFHENLSRL